MSHTHDAKVVKKARGRPESPEPMKRLHLSLPTSLIERMHEMQIETHASSMTELVKQALTLYAAALKEHKEGGHVYLKREGEEVMRQLTLFI
jgi:hypothetical protein